MGTAASTALRVPRRRFQKYGSEYFATNILPKCRDLLNVIDMPAYPAAAKIFDSFVKMDTNGNGTVNVVEFHRFMSWRRGIYTERIFDLYALQKEKGQTPQAKTEIEFNEFLVCIWNYASYDPRLMAKYIFNIFDIDKKGMLSFEECDALIRLVYFDDKDNGSDALMSVKEKCGKCNELKLEAFMDMVVADNSIIQPAFDVQSRIIERIGCSDTLWKNLRKKRLMKFGPNEVPTITYEGACISTKAVINGNEDGLSNDFLSSLFRRVERKIDIPEGYDHRMTEERYEDQLRNELQKIDTILTTTDFIIERIGEKTELRHRLWQLIEEIKQVHEESLEAELERDLVLFRKYASASAQDPTGSAKNPLEEFSSEQEIREMYEEMLSFFSSRWDRFVSNYEDRYLPRTSCWEQLYDPSKQTLYWFNWTKSESYWGHDESLGLPAICEACDDMILSTDYKCFNCDTFRSERNRKKYRGKVPLDILEKECTTS